MADNLLSIVLIAVALSMDALAVSITCGIAIHRLKLRHALLIALWFGGFQALMPLFGWWSGRQARGLIQAFDHWVAFGLLSFIGMKMILDARRPHAENPANPLRLTTLFFLAVSTSIDALAIGITLSLLEISILLPVVLIGTVAFGFSLAGTYIGNIFGHLFEKKLEIAGGLVLIAIGVKILLEHLLLFPH